MKKSARRKKKSQTDRTPEQTKREVLGVCLIALGLFLGASLYSDAVGLVGKAVDGFFFGMIGLVGYAIPALTIIWGVLVIIFSEKPVRPLTAFLVALFFLSLLSAMHIGARDSIESVKALDYFKDAYAYGKTYRAGGGFVGSLLAYPSLLLMGKIGSYIVFIAAMLIAFLVTTRLSLKRAGEKLGQGIKQGVGVVSERMSERRGALYTEDLSEPEDIRPKPVAKGKQEKKVFKAQDDLFRMEPVREDDFAGNPSKVKNAPDTLEFLPTSGALERKSPHGDRIEKEFDRMQPEHMPEGEYFVTDEMEADSPAAGRIARNAPAIKRSDRAQTARAEENVRANEPEKAPEHVPIVYQRPPYDLLNPVEQAFSPTESPIEKAKLLEDTLATFNISAKVINYSVGPVITRFELQPAKGVRVNRITALSQDLALALAAQRVRIEAPIPGKQAIGIEIPNKNTAKVLLREVVESREFQAEKSPIAFALGKDIAGKIITADLDRMPHMLIAGSTGSGKSVCINDIIISMAYKSSPDDLRLVLIDPKVVEMRMYAALPHLMLPVVTDAKKAAGALKWTVMEMERRYKLIAELNARDLSRYNQLVSDPAEKLAKLVVVIDELADLMMVAAKDVEDSICRIAQLGRAAGIHMIVATQRPSTDVITGLIKANIPSRIAFAVSSAVDSRVILDEGGAEKLLGKGDMLFHANGASKPVRAQAALVTDEEVERVMDFFGEHVEAQPLREDDFEKLASCASSGGAQGNGKQEDDLLPEAVKIVLNDGQASISMIQRKLRVGYARAARLIDIMENLKIVSASEGSKPRRVLIGRADYERMFGAAGSVQGETTYED
jgi:S-DNA-T family DNA segregation ATPase FtsK/SpoIIIE